VERLVMHPRYRATKHEIETSWSLEDVARAHLALDISEDMEVLRANRDFDLRPPGRSR